MELYKEILIKALSNKRMVVEIPDLKMDAAQIVEMECYHALNQIKAVIQDESLEDEECFAKIEEIVCILERVGSDGGFRHDYS